MPFTMEHLYEIWNDDNGDRVEIGPDRDSLDMVEIRWKDQEGNIMSRMVFPPEMVPLIIKALEGSLRSLKGS